MLLLLLLLLLLLVVVAVMLVLVLVLVLVVELLEMPLAPGRLVLPSRLANTVVVVVAGWFVVDSLAIRLVCLRRLLPF